VIARLSLEDIAHALGGEVAGDQVCAPGPGHSEKDRSLSVKFDSGAPDGFLVHSFAGDDGIECKDYVREKLGLGKWHPDRRTSPILDEYIYRTENQEPYLRVQRTRQKQFPQSHWDGGSWKKGKPKGPKIPYRLPELIKADEVYIAEGEKDANRLAMHGLAATTASEGAGKWTADLNQWFVGKKVYILPDNDWRGSEHATLVARNLAGVATTVRIVKLPGLPEKGDVSDWFNNGGNAEKLSGLAAEASEWAPQPGSSEPRESKLLLTSAEFVADFVPPDYLIDGLIQRRYFYSMTAPTGAGKTCVVLRIAAHATLALPLGDKFVEKVRVLFFAGENPDDVRARWIKLCEELGQKPEAMEVFFLAGAPPITSDEIRKMIDAEAEKHGPFGLVIVDTSAAFFRGEDENSNAQLGDHARKLRSFVDLPGGPAVIVTCHPTKTPNMDNLLPRGGGAFVAEVDGNLVCLKEGSVVVLHWQGKFRGPEFEPIPFKLQRGQTDSLKDSKGRKIWTVTATPISEVERSALRDSLHERENQLLALMKAHPDLSLAQMAVKLGWRNSKGQPYKSLVVRTREALNKAKLVELVRGDWVLTKGGKKAAPDWAPTQGEMALDDQII
jgi:AAA domain